MIFDYTIRINGEFGFVILPPHMIERLIHKIRNSHTQELAIPAEELLSRGYAEYLSRVLEANASIAGSFPYRNACSLMAGQIKKLQCNEQDCFYDVKVKSPENNPLFDMETMENFYIVTKDENSRFCYAFQGEHGEEVNIVLECPF